MFNGFGDYSPFSGNTEFRVFQEPAPERASAPARQRPRTQTHVEAPVEARVEAPVAVAAPETPKAPKAPAPSKVKQVKVAEAPAVPAPEPDKPKAPKAPRLKVIADALKPTATATSTASATTSRKSTVMSVLWKQAQQRGDIKGYNRMSRAQLETALGLNSSQS